MTCDWCPGKAFDTWFVKSDEWPSYVTYFCCWTCYWRLVQNKSLRFMYQPSHIEQSAFSIRRRNARL